MRLTLWFGRLRGERSPSLSDFAQDSATGPSGAQLAMTLAESAIDGFRRRHSADVRWEREAAASGRRLPRVVRKYCAVGLRTLAHSATPVLTHF